MIIQNDNSIKRLALLSVKNILQSIFDSFWHVYEIIYIGFVFQKTEKLYWQTICQCNDNIYFKDLFIVHILHVSYDLTFMMENWFQYLVLCANAVSK